MLDKYAFVLDSSSSDEEISTKNLFKTNKADQPIQSSSG